MPSLKGARCLQGGPEDLLDARALRLNTNDAQGSLTVMTRINRSRTPARIVCILTPTKMSVELLFSGIDQTTGSS